MSFGNEREFIDFLEEKEKKQGERKKIANRKEVRKWPKLR